MSVLAVPTTAPTGHLRVPAVALAALPIAALLALGRAGVHLTVPRSWYAPLHAVLELCVVAALIATVGVQWFGSAARPSADARAPFLGGALLAGAVLQVLHLFTFPGMPGFQGPEATSDRTITYWLAARVWTVGALLVAPRLAPARRTARRSALLIAVNVAAVAAVIAWDVSAPLGRAIFYVNGQGLTPLKVGIEGALAAAAGLGAFVHARRARATGDRALGRISAALAVTTLSEACFTLYATVNDAFNLLGHLYLLGAVAFMFDALFVAALVRPYEELASLRAHVEDELEVTIARLRERTEQRDDLLRAVSHDLRTPLQVVLLQGFRLLRAEDEDRRRSGRAITAAAKRMDRMLADLVDSARLESGQLVLGRQPIAMHRLVEDLLSGNEGALDTDRVTNAVPADLPLVDADPDRLERIVVNLVGNALKYSTGPVRVEAARHGAEVRVSVRDEGPGIPLDEQPRLFDRYSRPGGGDQEGLGLGLFIVRRLVEAHRGRVWVESAPGRGSTFSFTLPPAP
jgi:signal transduction histidine kinase